MSRLQAGEWFWLGSDAINHEVSQTPDFERRRRVEALISAGQSSIPLTAADITRTKALQALGFKQWDALHLACAERGQADIFLTTDDKLLRLAQKVADQLQVRVANPLAWLTEVAE